MSLVLVTKEGGVGTVTLNRPDRRNAINDAMRHLLAAAFAEFEADAALRVAILTGAPPAFCAGVDLSDAPEGPPPPNRPRLTDPLDRFSKPVIAAVNGPAMGGGFELALACDIQIAAAGARFGLPEVRIGSLPGSGGTQRLAAAVGSALAAEMLLTGEPIEAERALSAGLVSQMVEEDALAQTAQNLARTIARNAPLSLYAVKRALRAAVEGPLASGFDLERALYNHLALTDDRAEGRAAFREKRPPQYRGN